MREFTCRALLFDLDGTLVNSLPAVDRCWGAWAERNGMDYDYVVSQIHGRRSIDSIRLLRPDLDAEAEDAWLRAAEATDTEGVTAIPGAVELVGCVPPAGFAVVTSGTTDVAHARLKAVGITPPANGVYGEDVIHGKPHPEPFLLAAERLGVDPAECVAFEDTPPGVSSAKEAGMRVIAVATWRTEEQLSEADAIVPDLRNITVTTGADGELIVRVP